MQCPYCQQEHPDNVKFCPITGQSLVTISKTLTCPKCGSEIPLGLVFCPHCGHDMQRTKGLSTAPLVVAAFLGVALVAIGIWLVWPKIQENRGGLDSVASSMPSASSQQPSNQDIPGIVVAPGNEQNVDVLVVEASVTPTPMPTETVTLTPTLPPPTATIAATKTLLPSATATPSPIPYVVNPIDDAELVFIPAGEFSMGSDPKVDPYFFGSEGPPHTVTLSDFWIYRTEVTNAMYQGCVEAKACPQPINVRSNTRPDYYRNPSFTDYPVVYVTWKNANSYCQWAGARLPTEAEWEKAARGTDGRLFPWGNQAPIPNYANYGSRDTEAVGSYPDGASPYDVLDMAGNVIEWVRDYFQATYYQVSPDENPLGPASGSTRVYRGGAYHNPAAAIRTVMRGSRSESHANVDIGFRCVMDIEP